MKYDWHKVLVNPDSSFQQAVAAINAGSLRIALVADAERRLVGTVTDGDVRRALLRGVALEAPISEIMNRSPKFAEKGTPKVKIRAMMEQDDLLTIPLLDEGVLVGLETLQNIIAQRKYDNPVVLMAGGFGTRLRPLTECCPKPLLRVGDKPILETILEGFVDAGFHQFYISTHYLPEMIRSHFGDGSNWGVNINYIHEEEPLGTGGALGLLPESLPELPLVLMNGDLLTKVDFEQLVRFHEQTDAVATVCGRHYEQQVPYGVIQVDEHSITEIVEKPTQRFFVNAGIYVLGPDILAAVRKNQKIDMPTLLDEFIAKGSQVSMFPLHEYWLDIGRMNDFEQAQQDVLNFFK